MSDDSSDTEPVGNSELMTRERIQDIVTARREVREIRNRIVKARTEARGPETALVDEGAAQVYRGYVETYFTEIEPLLLASDAGTELWRAREFGTVKIQPPVEDQHGSVGITVDGSTQQLRGPVPTPKVAELSGLVSLLRHTTPLTATWTVDTAHLGFTGKSTDSETATAEATVPFATIDQMYRAANEHLHELGYGPSLESNSVYNISLGSNGDQANTNGTNE